MHKKSIDPRLASILLEVTNCNTFYTFDKNDPVFVKFYMEGILFQFPFQKPNVWKFEKSIILQIQHLT